MNMRNSVTLTFFKKNGSKEGDDFLGTYSEPGTPPGEWQFLMRNVEFRSKKIITEIVEYTDSKSLSEGYDTKVKTCPYLDMRYGDDVKNSISYPKNGSLKSYDIIKWVNATYIALTEGKSDIINLQELDISELSEPKDPVNNKKHSDSVDNSPIIDQQFVDTASNIITELNKDSWGGITAGTALTLGIAAFGGILLGSFLAEADEDLESAINKSTLKSLLLKRELQEDDLEDPNKDANNFWNETIPNDNNSKFKKKGQCVYDDNIKYEIEEDGDLFITDAEEQEKIN